MLKSLALMVPAIRNLYEERNLYAKELQRLEEENNRFRMIGDACNAIAKNVVVLDEKIDSIRGELKDNRETNSAHLVPALSTIDLSDRGLFVVGHARSGTTILLDALNSSRDVYCLGEANLHKSIARTDFSCWFNKMHRSFNNPLMKSTYLPDFQDKSGWYVLKKMSEQYKYVGEKVAFRQEEMGYDYSSFFNFSAKNFQSSNYICLVRHPRSVSASNIEMFMSGRIDDSSLDQIAISQLQSYYLIICLVLTLKNVFVLVHERIQQDIFDLLGRSLHINLENAGSYYDFNKTVTSPELADRIPISGINTCIGYYERFKSIFCNLNLRPINSLAARDLAFDLYSELKSMNRLPRIDYEAV